LIEHTTFATFIDANVPLYASGREHPLREPCVDILDLAAQHHDAFVTDAEVLQELLHRYLALRLWPQGVPLFARFASLMRSRTAAILGPDVERAAELASRYPGLSARDIIHVAVMKRLTVTRIVSADQGFDRLPDIERLDPARFSEWRNSIVV
jgi:uncharacterized protein